MLPGSSLNRRAAIAHQADVLDCARFNGIADPQIQGGSAADGTSSDATGIGGVRDLRK